MSARLRLTILGCGSSPGTPRINGDWGACDPKEPRNRRRRSSALVERITADGTTTVVIDVGPDFREQMLSASVTRLDAAVITHPHADHIHGLDDLRGFAQEAASRRIPVHADAETHGRMLEAFRYCYETPRGSNYEPIVVNVPIEAGNPFEITGPGGAIGFRPFRQLHGSIHSLGFRIGPIAYCTDVSHFPDDAILGIQGAGHVVIDALQHKPHPSHLTLDEALGWLDRFGAPAATLTHMHTPLDYATLCGDLPAHIRPGYDGMTIEFTVD